MSRLTPDARQAANVDAYKAALSMFWGNMTALEQIVEEDFPTGQMRQSPRRGIRSMRYATWVTASGRWLRGIACRFLSSGATGRPLPTLLARQVATQRRLAGCQR
jgi:hypothetical protein